MHLAGARVHRVQGRRDVDDTRRPGIVVTETIGKVVLGVEPDGFML
jgi:hypothetical protein